MARRNSIHKERIVIFMLSGVLLVLVVVFSGLITRTHREYRQLKEREARFERELAQVRIEIEQRRAFLDQLREDPEFREREVRERLNYARPGELVFRFDDE